MSAANWQLDAGVLYFDDVKVGVCRGGATFESGAEIRDPEWVGKRHKTAGTRRITYRIPKLTVRLMEWDSTNITTASINNTLGVVDDAVYIDKVTYVTDKHTVELANALPDGDLNIVTEDQNEGRLEFAFIPHYDADDHDFDTPPWSVTMNT